MRPGDTSRGLACLLLLTHFTVWLGAVVTGRTAFGAVNLGSLCTRRPLLSRRIARTLDKKSLKLRVLPWFTRASFVLD